MIFWQGRFVLAAVMLACVPAVARADWPVYGHDLSNSRDAGRAGPSADRLPALQQAWKFSSPSGDFTGTPVIAGGVLVAGSNTGTVYALDAATGKLRWSRNVGQQVNGSAAIDLHRGLAFVPVANTGAPRLAALSLK